MRTKRLFFLPLLLVVFSSQAFCFSSKISTLSNGIQKEMISKKTYVADYCPLAPDRLRLVNFSYYDFEGISHDSGEIVVMDAVAIYVENIFRELYERKFPIEKSKRIEHYDGSDELSLADNNSSCFNCREMIGGSSLPSIHSYGLAIDINPIQNPYIRNAGEGKVTVLPSKGTSYLNRSNIRPGMVEQIVDIFKQNGFRIWGGKWNDPIDWQHFQTPRIVAKIMATMKPNDARVFFALYVKNPQLFDKISYDKEEIISLYNHDSVRFMKVLKDNFEELNKFAATGGIEKAIDFLKENLASLKTDL